MSHTYITQNGKVVRETIGTGATAKVLDFIYDNNGRPFALRCSTNGGNSFATHYYVLNLQGDVVLLSRGYNATFMDVYNAAFDFNALADNGKNGMYFEGTVNALEHLLNVSGKNISGTNFPSLLILYGYYDDNNQRHGGHYIAGVGRGAEEYIFLNDLFTPNNPMSIDEYVYILSGMRLVDPSTFRGYTIMIDFVYIVGG